MKKIICSFCLSGLIFSGCPDQKVYQNQDAIDAGMKKVSAELGKTGVYSEPMRVNENHDVRTYTHRTRGRKGQTTEVEVRATRSGVGWKIENVEVTSNADSVDAVEKIVDNLKNDKGVW